MKLKYKLLSISVRRRPRFGPDRVWTNIETHTELELISPETGEPIEGSVTFEQTNLSYHWDEDLQEDGKKVPAKLLINSDTPFSFTTEDTEADENIIHENPEWPCCGKTSVQWHWYNFRLEPIGVLNKRLRRVFHPANGFQIITADGLIIPQKLTDTGNPEHVAAFTITATKQIMRLVFDEDAIFVGIFVSAIVKDKGSVTLIAENTQGEQVLTITHTFSNRNTGWEYVTISGKSFRSVSIIADSYQRVWTLYMDMASWLSAADYEKNHIDKQSCSTTNPNRATDFAGNGGLFFLPNHEYEIAFKTEIAVRHNSTEWEARTCEEFAYFITKGLPGLNYTKNIGAEMTPYVQTPYPLMPPFIYAEEPVVLTLNEKYKLSLPISARRPGDLEEHIQMTNLRLVVKSNTGESPVKPWDEAPVDWITAKARSRPVIIKGDYQKKTARSISTDVRLKRLSTLRNLSTAAGCSGSNVLEVSHSILAAFPCDKSIGGIKYWDKEKQCTAYLELDNQIFIDHSSFVEEDLAGFDYDTHALGSWAVKDRKLVAAGMASLETARFGATDWNYFNLSTEISGLDGEAGFIVAQNSAPLTHLYVLCSNTSEALS